MSISVPRVVHPIEKHVEEERGGDSKTHQDVTSQIQCHVVGCPRRPQLQNDIRIRLLKRGHEVILSLLATASQLQIYLQILCTMEHAKCEILKV